MNVYVHKAGIMQDMLRHIAKGYVWYFHGTVHVTKAEQFAAKMSAHYAVRLTAIQRANRKARGLANARLFLYPRHDRFEFEYVVLLTDGAHPARDVERLRSVTDKRSRLIFDERFEALILPAAGSVPRWTWRLTPEAFEAQVTAVKIAVRKRDDDTDIRRVISGIYAMPGFRGLRQQMAALLRLLQGEWKRVRDTAACPYASTKLKGYLRLVDIQLVPLNDAVRRIAAGGRAIPLDLVYDRTSSSMANKPFKLSIAPTQAAPCTLKRVQLPADVYSDFVEYRNAFNAHYGVDIDEDDLAAKLIELALKREVRSRPVRRNSRGDGAAAREGADATKASAAEAEA